MKNVYESAIKTAEAWHKVLEVEMLLENLEFLSLLEEVKKDA